MKHEPLPRQIAGTHERELFDQYNKVRRAVERAISGAQRGIILRPTDVTRRAGRGHLGHQDCCQQTGRVTHR